VGCTAEGFSGGGCTRVFPILAAIRLITTFWQSPVDDDAVPVDAVYEMYEYLICSSQTASFHLRRLAQLDRAGIHAFPMTSSQFLSTTRVTQPPTPQGRDESSNAPARN
jgi:hypothetical protein